MSDLIENTLKIITKRQYNAKNNISNCIPCPLPKLSKEWSGLERRKYIIVAGSDKSSKTQFSSFLFIYNSLHYAMKHPNTKVDILYFNLEEDREDILNRYILYLLKTKYNILSNSDELLSTISALPDNIYNIIQSKDFHIYLEYFKDHVSFSSVNTVPEMIKTIKEWNDKYGTYDEHNRFKLKNANHYRIVLTDHIGLIDPLRGESLYNTLRFYSHKCIQLRDAYDLTICSIQQCSSNTEGLEAIKMSRLMPTKHTLSDYRSSINDVNTMFGIFNPSKVDINEFKGYVIYDSINKESKLGDNARFINIMANRGGRLGAVIGLYTDGSNAYFEELPHYREENKLNIIYERIRNNNKDSKETNTLFTPMNSNNNGMPSKKTTIKAFMAKILNISKLKKKYNINWDVHSLPDELDVDGMRFIPMVNQTGDTCSKCWFQKDCAKSNIPCTPIVYWVLKNPDNDNSSSINNENVEENGNEIKASRNGKIGF